MIPKAITAALSLFVTLAISSAAAQTPSSEPAVRFAYVDVVVDPHGTPLAAYQVEFSADPARVTLVGVEGGEHPAYKDPPYYDPKALQSHRVIIAALNTGSDLPQASIRVARLHLQIVGPDKLETSAKLIAAASPDAKPIKADVTVSEGANP